MKAISLIQKIDYFWAQSLPSWWETEFENIAPNLLQATVLAIQLWTQKNHHRFYKSIKWILQVNKIRMMTKVTFWFSDILFDSTILRHPNSIVSTSCPKENMTKEIPYWRKTFDSLESCWVYPKRKDSENIISQSAPV